MARTPKGRLELTWMGKDLSLIPTEHGKYDYQWVDPSDPRVREIRTIDVVETIGDATGSTGAGENWTKKRAAENWARFVRDNGNHGTWRYLFATESDIRAAGGSWPRLLHLARPE